MSDAAPEASQSAMTANGSHIWQDNVKVYSARVRRELHFIEGGTPANTYTRPELKILVDENRKQPFTDAELIRIDALKKNFSATISGCITVKGERLPQAFQRSFDLGGGVTRSRQDDSHLSPSASPSPIPDEDDDDEDW